MITIRSALEALMYLAFSAAALPFAWLGMTEALYYRAHPEMLQSRDSAPLVLPVMMAMDLMKPALGLAVLLSLYFLMAGPRALRLSAAVLIVAWLLTFASMFFGTLPPFASIGRLYWDAVLPVALSILPWICAGIRLAHHGAGQAAASSGASHRAPEVQ